MGTSEPSRPRVLVTGFPPFPGAPVNPTKRLVGLIRERAGEGPGGCPLHAALLSCAYGPLPGELSLLGARLAPDIAIHFGLSRRALGFTLERFGRNRCDPFLPDAADARPTDATIRDDGPPSIASTLPLAEIHAALVAEGLPASLSDDAGDYVCNYTLYHVAGGLIPDFRPAMAGFVHIPPLDDQRAAFIAAHPDEPPPGTLTEDALWRGACRIVTVCADMWRSRRKAESGTRGPALRNVTR